MAGEPSPEEERIQKELDALRAARLKLLTNGVANYAIAGRTTVFQDPAMLVTIEKSLLSQLRMARRCRIIENGGADPDKVRVVFR